MEEQRLEYVKPTVNTLHGKWGTNVSHGLWRYNLYSVGSDFRRHDVLLVLGRIGMSEEQQAEGVARGRAIIAWVVAPLVCTCLLPHDLLLLIGMAPSIVAYIVDKRPRR